MRRVDRKDARKLWRAGLPTFEGAFLMQVERLETYTMA